ncbi:HAD family phosphatase [soil metagenome]
MPQPLLFVFDMDNVLYDYDWRVRMAGLSKLTGHDFHELRRRWWNNEGEWAAEAGVFPDAASYHAALTTALGVDLAVDDWVANRRSAMTPWADSIAAVERASQLGAVSLLTNNGALMQEHLAEVAPEIAPLFGDHLYTSSDYGARKPDPLVFRNLLKRYEMDAADVFFTDDLAENVAGARSVGITSHRFTNARRLTRAIEKFAKARRQDRAGAF